MRKNSKRTRDSGFGGSKPGFFKTDCREKQRRNSGKTASRNSAKQRDSREVILRFRELSTEDQQAVIAFLKQL